MGAFFVYILKASVYLAILYLFYSILLSKETFYRYNRTALLLLIPLSFILPLYPVHTAVPETYSNTTILDSLPTISYIENESQSKIPIGIITVLSIYLIGILYFITRYACTIIKLLRLIRSGEKYTDSDGLSLVVISQSIAPFSWFGKIVISEADLQNHRREILLHESAHIRKHHSWDLLAADFCIGLQWFNPAAWLLKRELQTVHEYEADNYVLEQGIDAKQYQLLLIKRSVGSKFYYITNHFNHNKLNKRITMMLKKKSNRKATLKYLYVIPVALCTVSVFAHPEISDELNKVSSVDLSNLTAMIGSSENTATIKNKEIEISGCVLDIETNEPIVGATVLVKGSNTRTVTDLNGNFSLKTPIGKTLLISYVGLGSAEISCNDKDRQNLKIYLGESSEKNNSSKIIIVGNKTEPNTSIGTKGKINSITITTKDSAENNRQKINTKGKISNINVDVQKDGSVIVDENNNTRVFYDPIYILDGKKISKDKFKNLDADKIKSITVLKGEEAIKSYGKDGENGALIIQTKGNAATSTDPIKTITITKKDTSEDIMKNTFCIVDGKKISETELKNIDPNNIQSITVLKDEKSKEKYGATDKDCVIWITLKK